MMYYNFVRIHKTLRVTPAIAAGVADRLWEIADIAQLVEDAGAAPKVRGLYKKAVKSSCWAVPGEVIYIHRRP
jgi:hypothetical protein